MRGIKIGFSFFPMRKKQRYFNAMSIFAH